MPRLREARTAITISAMVGETHREGGAPASARRSHRSSLCIVPPRECWEPIQALRRDHDRKIGRWMPHVNLLYPFRPESCAGEVEPVLERAMGECARFELALERIAVFDHGRSIHTIWLAPEPRDPIDTLHERARALFPDCRDVDRHAHGFTPHLALGQARGERELERVLADVRARWRPLRFAVDRVVWAVRPPEGPFEVRAEFPLG
jgi:2'-5' RNA ligase